MRAPEIVYSYQWPKDLASISLEVVRRRGSTSGASISYQVNGFTVPNDRVFLLQQSHLEVTSAGAVSPSLLVHRYNLPGTGVTSPYIFSRWDDWEGVAAVGSTVSTDWVGELWLGPGDLIDYFAALTGAQAGTGIVFSLTGLLIPRANVAFG